MNKKVIVKKNMIYVLEDGMLVEFINLKETNTGNIYLGKVKEVKKAVGSIFVDISKKEKGYLQTKKVYNIGEEILVEIKKDKTDEKLVNLTDNISVKGKNLILNLRGEGVKFSEGFDRDGSKIKEMLKGKEYQIIVREEAEEDKILKEYEFLNKRMKDLIKRSSGMLNDRDVYINKDSAYRALTENKCVDEYITEDETIYNKLERYAEAFGINKDGIKLVKDLDIVFDLNKKYSDIGKKYVWLKSGGKIIFDKTEAMNVIDINTGKNTTSKNLEKNIEKTNIDAAKEIVRQIRLKNLSGIIIIDFINMKSKEKQQEVLDIVKEELKKDKNKTAVYGYTKLGLLEMTREKR
ncbi:MAG: ribonuclease E/G [Clostridia bacterium]|jgi:ribonuclease G|nr:ribonuclease E/G [Clostridia bacterium]